MTTERSLAQSFTEDHPAEAASVIERLSPAAAVAYLEALPPRAAAGVMQKMTVTSGAECIGLFSSHRFPSLISALPLDCGARLLRRLDAERREPLLEQAPAGIAAMLHRILRFPEDCAGALMDPQVLALPDDITVTEALARIRRSPRHTLYYLYIVNREQKLVGVMNLRELMLAAPKELLSATMRRELTTLNALMDRAAILDHPGWRNVHALPVTDDSGVFLGVVRYQMLRQLETTNKSSQPGANALSTVLTLGELCWVGLAGVLTDLTTAAGAKATTLKESSRG